MPRVLGLFADRGQAVAALEGLRAARFDTDGVRLVGGPSKAGELAADAGPGASVAAGPTPAVVGSLLEGDLAEEQLRSFERRVAEGAVLLVAEDVDEAGARQLTTLLRERGAEQVVAQAEA
jgi:hypothetical protein